MSDAPLRKHSLIALATEPAPPLLALLLSIVLVLIPFALAFHSLRGITEASLFEVKTGVGPFVRSIMVQGRYVACLPPSGPVTNELCYYTLRLPFVPYFIAALGSVSKNLVLVHALKSAIFCTSVLGYLLFVIRRERGISLPRIAVLGAFLLIPYVFLLSHDLSYEEGYLTAMFPAIVALAWLGNKNLHAVVLGLVCAAAALTKSSVFPAILLCAGVAYFRFRRAGVSRLAAMAPLAAVVLGLAGWATFSWSHTGVWAAGSKMSSMNGLNLYHGHTRLFAEIYPQTSLDLIEDRDLTEIPRTTYRSEWEVNDAYVNFAKRYMAEHPLQTAKDTLTKVWVALGSFTADGATLAEQAARKSRLRPTTVAVRLIVSGSLILALLTLFAKRGSAYFSLRPLSSFYLVFSVIYLLPYIVGFIYPRHLLPVVSRRVV